MDALNAILIKNGRLIDPHSNRDETVDIFIQKGTISRIIPKSQTPVDFTVPENTAVINAEKLVICPGFIDIHVHLREPGQEHKETIETGAKAAAAGGFTSIACMPNTTPVNDNVSITRQILSTARDKAVVNVFPIAAISINSDGQETVDMKVLVKEGVKGFSDDGRCVMDPDIFRRALLTAKELNVPVIEHPEDHAQTDGGQVTNGPAAEKYGLQTIPAAAEDEIIQRDIQLQKETGAHLHLTHISTAGGLEAIKKARENFKQTDINNNHPLPLVTSDVTPHHLLLTDEALLEKKDSSFKMKPPLRSEKDRQAMITGIQTGLIDCIATDHAPHSADEKNAPFQQAPFGITGLETAVPLIYDRFVRTGQITLQQFVKLFSTNPARIIGLANRGKVAEGLPADLTILDLQAPFHIREPFFSKSSNSPFIGCKGVGTVAYTIVSGKVVYQNNTRQPGEQD